MHTEDAIERRLLTWLKSYELTFAEYTVLECAVRHEHSVTLIAKLRFVTLSTVKKQSYSIIKKSGDASLGHAALRLLREANEEMRAAAAA